MSVVSDVSNAVVSELNSAPAGTFNQAFTAARASVPAFELSELTDLHVTIVPRSLETQVSTRAYTWFDVKVDIGIQKKLGKDLDTEIAPLLELVEQVAAYLRGKQLAHLPNAAWLGTSNDPIYAADHLAEQRLFTSVLTVTYRVMK